MRQQPGHDLFYRYLEAKTRLNRVAKAKRLESKKKRGSIKANRGKIETRQIHLQAPVVPQGPRRSRDEADRLHGEGYQPLFFGGPGDASLVDGIRARCGNPAPSAQGRLGLGGARRLVDEFQITSEPGRGTTFEVVLGKFSAAYLLYLVLWACTGAFFYLFSHYAGEQPVLEPGPLVT